MSRRARGIHTRVLVKFNTRGGERREGGDSMVEESDQKDQCMLEKFEEDPMPRPTGKENGCQPLGIYLVFRIHFTYISYIYIYIYI